MRKKLEKHIKKVCKRSLHTACGKDLYDELLQNTLERYDEELARGRSERDAYEVAIASIGNMEPIVRKTSKRSGKRLILCAAAVICLLAIVVTGCAVTSIEYYDDASSYLVGDASFQDEIHSLEINWVSGEVKLSAYDGDEITLTETGAKTEDQKMRYLVKNGVLHIQYQASGINIGWSGAKTLEVKIPREMAQDLQNGELELAGADASIDGFGFASFEIETASGNVTATDCAFGSFEADTASGDYKLENCAIGSVEMSAASGNTVIEGAVRSVEFDSASGNLTIRSNETPKKLSIDTASGNIKLTIPSSSEFSCEYETASGEVEFNGFAGNYREDEFICGNSANEYEIDTASGNITINAE